jgi:hypothetical protein
MPVNFRGLVGKSFRPPELHEQQSYAATKVDSWCLGWSTFYLLTAQPLFMSADPAQQDSDWLLFQNGDFATLFQQKANLCSPTALDFIFRLLQIKPRNRMSIKDALNHSWLADPSIEPVRAPKDVLAEMYASMDRPLEVVDGYDSNQKHTNSQNLLDGKSGLSQGTSYSPPTKIAYGKNELPTWAAANNSGSVQIFGGVPYGSSGVPVAGRADGPVLRVPLTQQARAEVRSPPRSPRSPRTSGLTPNAPRLAFPDRLSFDRLGAGTERARYQPPRMAHVISTAHSPAPGLNRGSPPPRANSPLQRLSSPASQKADLGYVGDGSYSASALPSAVPQPALSAMLTPRSASGRLSPGSSPLSSAVPGPNQQADGDEHRGRAWAFRSEGPTNERVPPLVRNVSPFGGSQSNLRPGSSSWQVPHSASNGRLLPSPGRRSGTGISFPRVPGSPEGSPAAGGGGAVRHISPGASGRGPLAGSTRINDAGGGFNWTAVPVSPRSAGPQGSSMNRVGSPGAGIARIASPAAGGLKAQPFSQGFAWSPDPPSPRTSPRSYSPGPAFPPNMKASSSVPRWPM